MPLEVPYQPRFYLHAPGVQFEDYAPLFESHPLVSAVTPEFHRLHLRSARHPVLAVTVSSCTQFPRVVREIKALAVPRFRVFNGDLSAVQLWYLEQQRYPFEQVKVHTDQSGTRVTQINSCDSRKALDYHLPPFDTVDLHLEGEDLFCASSSHGDTLQTTEPMMLQDWINTQNPDIIFTHEGDNRIFPTLIQRVQKSGMLRQFSLSRDHTPHVFSDKALPAGRAVFRYGGPVLHRPHPFLLRGRLHLDRSHMTFGTFEGLIEASRLTAFPPQRMARSSPGTGINMLQMQEALNRGVLIPETKADPEEYKTGLELLNADRGGHVITPRVGVFCDVGELDFLSMYPALMVKHNISPEALFCDCCPDDATVVPELGYWLCRRQPGIVPTFLKPILEKRTYYKQHRHDNPVYEARQAALKWLLVVCLDSDEIVPIRFNDELQLVKIGEFIDQHLTSPGVQPCNANVDVIGFDDQYKATFVPVKRFFKLDAPDTLIKVKVEGGREITLTPDHPSYVLDNGQLEVRETRHLKRGDFLPVMLSVPTDSRHYQFDFIEVLLSKQSEKTLDEWRVRGSILRKAITEQRNTIMSALSQGRHTRQALNNWQREGFIPLRYFKLLNIPAKEHHQLWIGRGRRKGGLVQWIPATIPLDEELAFLLGFFVGDGSATKNMIRLDVNSEDVVLLKKIEHTVSTIFSLKGHVRKEPQANMHVMQINSIALVELLEKAFLIGPTASRGRLQIPDYILNAQKDIRYAFLAGLIASDGSVERARNVIRIGTKSEALLNQLGYLALTLNIDFLLNRSKKKGVTHVFRVTGRESLTHIQSNCFLKKKHDQILHGKTTSQRPQSRIRDIPVHETRLRQLARKYRTVRNPRIDSTEKTPRSSATFLLDRLLDKPTLSKADHNQLVFIRQLIESDMGFAKVTEITKVKPSSKNVYCFEVDNPLSGFAAGKGGIFTHNCFGYLGFRASRFGRVEAYECVTAFSRRVLLQTKAVCERKGYDVLHGIVDCVWLQKPGATVEDYIAVGEAIHEVTGLPIEFEGRYRWIMFLPCRNQPYGALTRYYGVKEDGTIKVRGIELRRRDTPPFIKQLQLDLITCLAGAEDVEEMEQLLPQLLTIVKDYLDLLHSGGVTPDELSITQNISRLPHEYQQQCSQAIAAELAVRYGQDIQPGQPIKYVHTDSKSRHPLRRVALPNTAAAAHYDKDKYTELLLRATDTLLTPLGWNYERLASHFSDKPVQTLLDSHLRIRK
jgi:DNA polymerase elongation subunit (family B)